MFTFFAMLSYLSQFSIIETGNNIPHQTEALLRIRNFQEENISNHTQINLSRPYKEEKKKKTLSLSISLSWTEFFSGYSPSSADLNYWYNKEYGSGTRIIPAQNTAYVLECKFLECKYQGNGSVIHYDHVGEFLVEFSSFNECYASDLGGSIYTIQCDCVVNCVCSMKCHATNSGQFMSAKGGSGIATNQVHQSSICSGNGGYDSPVELYYGDQVFRLVNLSHYTVKYVCALYLDYGTSDPSVVTLCSFNTNHATSNRCFYLRRFGISFEVSKCNVINNTQAGSGEGIFRCEQTTKIRDCSVLMNDDKIPLFFLVGYWGGIIEVINCSLPDDCKPHSESGGTINMQAAYATKSFLHGLVLTADSEFCEAGTDVVGSLTPYIPTPTPCLIPSPCRLHQQYLIGHTFLDIFVFMPE